MSNETPKSASVSRRSILKGAIATAPLIATLPSGAALARSSSLIGAVSPARALDASGRTLCLDARSGVSTGTVMDLGPWPSGSVTAIRQRDYRREPRFSAAPISEGEMCTRGGNFYYRSSSWKTAKVPRGMLVSATALTSFAGSIHFTEV